MYFIINKNLPFIMTHNAGGISYKQIHGVSKRCQWYFL